MQAIASDPLFTQVNIEENLLPYLLYTGWRRVEDDNPKWVIINGREDVQGDPIRLVFPKEGSESDKERYALKAINALVAIDDKPLPQVLQSVVNYDRDVFYLRNLEHKDGAIPMDLAAKQINYLKLMIAYAACSEKEPLAYFPNLRAGARKIVPRFGFGHTAPGSFALTIVSPRLPDPIRFQANEKPEQQALFVSEQQTVAEDSPFERRVVERIARGLNLASQSGKEHDQTILMREFASGFNANMCTAALQLTNRNSPTIEWQFDWASKVRAGDDVINEPKVVLRRDAYDNLGFAARELKQAEPRYVTVVGHVRALTTNENPQSETAKRAIVIRGLHQDTDRAVDVIVYLNRDDYRRATEAHDQWHSVKAQGILVRSGVGWRLRDAKDFEVIK